MFVSFSRNDNMAIIQEAVSSYWPICLSTGYRIWFTCSPNLFGYTCMSSHKHVRSDNVRWIVPTVLFYYDACIYRNSFHDPSFRLIFYLWSSLCCIICLFRSEEIKWKQAHWIQAEPKHDMCIWWRPIWGFLLIRSIRFVFH